LRQRAALVAQKLEKYFAIVDTKGDDGKGAEGFWNAIPGASHGQTSLGRLTRKGACRAKVCAWK
jgi:hypothetical protein